MCEVREVGGMMGRCAGLQACCAIWHEKVGTLHSPHPAFFLLLRTPLPPPQRGLFERHKLLFALMLTNKILVSAGKVKASDVDVLLKGGGALDIASVSCVAGLAFHLQPNCQMRRSCSWLFVAIAANTAELKTTAI